MNETIEDSLSSGDASTADSVVASRPVLDYAPTSHDDYRLARQLRLVVGGGMFAYSVLVAVTVLVRYASAAGLIALDYGSNPSRLWVQIPYEFGSFLALYAGTGILWGSGSQVVMAGRAARVATMSMLVSLVIALAQSFFLAFHPQSKAYGPWYWIATTAMQLAYGVITVLFWMLSRGPVFARICSVARP